MNGENIMFCYKCGNQLPDEASFCNKCGAKVFGGETQQKTADTTNTGFETKNAAASTITNENAPSAMTHTQSSTQYTVDARSVQITSVALAEKEESKRATTLPQSGTISSQTQNQSKQQYQYDQNNFKQFVENYIAQNTAYRSTEELFNSKVSLRFAWLSYGIPFLLIVVLGFVRSMNIGEVLLLAVLVSLIVGFCVSQLMASFRRNRISMKSEVIFETNIDIDAFKEFLNKNLSTQYPYFHQWERLTWTGSMRANTINEIEEKYQQITLGAEFGSQSVIMLAKATIGPYQLNLQSGKNSISFTVTNIVAGLADLSFKKYRWSFKIIPVLQAAAEYYLKTRQIGSNFNNGTEQAPQTESVAYTQQLSSASTSNFSAVPAIAGMPTAKKKSKTAPIIVIAVILIIAAAVTAFMLWKKSYSDNEKKGDTSLIEAPVGEGHYTFESLSSTDSNVIIIGGVEYLAESADITGTPFSPSQLVDYCIEDWDCPDELTDLFLRIDHPEFINLYVYANDLYQAAGIGGSSIVLRVGATFDLPNTNSPYGETGYTFESFRSLLFDTFTEEYATKTLKSTYIESFGGELYHCTLGIGGVGLNVMKTEYVLKSLTDTEVEIQMIDYDSDNDVIETYDCKFKLTNEGWRVDKPFLWLG